MSSVMKLLYYGCEIRFACLMQLFVMTVDESIDR